MTLESAEFIDLPLTDLPDILGMYNDRVINRCRYSPRPQVT
jgi:hypothetical protein